MSSPTIEKRLLDRAVPFSELVEALATGQVAESRIEDPELARVIDRRTQELLTAAFDRQDPAAALELQRAIACCLRVRTSTVHTSASELSEVFALLSARLLRAWLEAEMARVDVSAVPTDLEGFTGWFEHTMANHPAADHPVYRFLEEEASLDQIKFFMSQESTVDAEFADLLAMTQIGAKESWKLEMAHNYWDEMGKGEAHRTHAGHFSRAMALLDLPPPGEVPLSAGALGCGNMLTLLAMHRSLCLHSVGALAATEMAVPRRFTRVVNAGRRLGLPADVIDYYLMHVEGDEHHAQGWLDNVVRPLVGEGPEAARALATGVMLRLNTSLIYCEELMAMLRAVAPSRPRTLATVLAKGVATTPGKIAISDGTRRLTYAALEELSTRLARVLHARGVRLEDRVAIVAEKECALVAGILGIAKSGAAYVPLDPASPPARLRVLVEDTAPVALLGPASFLAQLAESVPAGTPLLSFEEIREAIGGAAFPSEPPSDAELALPEVLPGALCFVMYTSGSTGRPKGVQIEHGPVIAFIDAHNEKLGVEASSRCMNTSPFHFDVSIMDTFLPLSVGATVHLTGVLPIRSALLGLLERERITHFCAVSSVLTLMTGDGRPLEVRDLSALRVVHFGGELCDVRVIEKWRKAIPGLTMINGYGPTETTVVCVTHTIQPGDPTPVSFYPIGVPHRGTELLLLDEAGRKIEEAGEKGELYIGGNLLMRGYLARPEEDLARLVTIDGARYYKTGDLCYRDAAGAYHFGGREDDEVKVSGYRIHLSEVRGALLGLSAVVEGVVGPLERSGDSRNALAAVVALDRPPAIDDVRALQEQLRAQLPAYMVPKYILACETSLPRLPSGKTDSGRAMQLLGEAVKRWGVELYRLPREGGDITPLEETSSASASASSASSASSQVSHG